MHLANPKWNCTDQKEEHFIDGITNGARWASLSGGMQDYNYVNSNCFEITLELGCNRFPKSSELKKYWLDNRKPLIELLRQVRHFFLPYMLILCWGAWIIPAMVRCFLQYHHGAVLVIRHVTFKQMLRQNGGALTVAIGKVENFVIQAV